MAKPWCLLTPAPASFRLRANNVKASKQMTMTFDLLTLEWLSPWPFCPPHLAVVPEHPSVTAFVNAACHRFNVAASFAPWRFCVLCISEPLILGLGPDTQWDFINVWMNKSENTPESCTSFKPFVISSYLICPFLPCCEIIWFDQITLILKASGSQNILSSRPLCNS